MYWKNYVSNHLVEIAGKYSPALKRAIEKHNKKVVFYCPESSDSVSIYVDNGITFNANRSYLEDNHIRSFFSSSNPEGVFCGSMYVDYQELEEFLSVVTGLESEENCNLSPCLMEEYKQLCEELEQLENDSCLDWSYYDLEYDSLFEYELNELVEMYGEGKENIIRDYLLENAYEMDGALCYDEREIEKIAG